MPAALLALILSPAAGPPPVGPAELVRQLGSEKYDVRLAAERRLLALGARAVPAVEAGRRHADLEVRRRCQPLLKALRSSLRAEYLKALRAGRPSASVPLWEHFRRRHGGGRAAVALFAEMYAAEGETFDEIAFALSRREHAEASREYQRQVERLIGPPIDARTQMMLPRPGLKPPPPADLPVRVKGALFLGALPGVELDDHGWGGLTGPLSYDVPLRRELAAKGPRGDLIRGLLGQWCLAARSEYAVWSALLQVLAEGGLGETGRALARRSLAHESWQVRAGAICILGHHGGREDIPRLLPLLKVKEHYHRTLSEHEVGDVALEALVRLTGQRASDYGINKRAPLFTTTHSLRDGKGHLEVLIPCYPIATYRKPAEREEAFRRWREWAKNHPEHVPPPPERPLGRREAYEAARDAAREQYIDRFRLLHWRRMAEPVGRASGLVRLTVEPDRLHVLPPADLPRPRAGEWRWGNVPVLGVAAVTFQAPDGLGRVGLVLKGAFSDDAAGVVSRTRLERDLGDILFEVEHRDWRETLLVRYEQPGKGEVSLTVRRTRNADGKVLADRKHAAKGLAALREAAPEDHALLLSLLRQTNALVAPKRSP